MKQISIKVADDTKAEQMQKALEKFVGETLAEKLYTALALAQRAVKYKKQADDLTTNLHEAERKMHAMRMQIEKLETEKRTIEFDAEMQDCSSSNSSSPLKEQLPEGSQAPETGSRDIETGSQDAKMGSQAPDDPENWLPEWVFSRKTGILLGILLLFFIVSLWAKVPKDTQELQVVTAKNSYINVDSVALATLKKVQGLTSQAE